MFGTSAAALTERSDTMSEHKQRTIETVDLCREQEELTAEQAERVDGGIIIDFRLSMDDASLPLETVSVNYSKVE
jgi:hypothetical protein